MYECIRDYLPQRLFRETFRDWWVRFHDTHLDYFALQPDGHRGLAKRCGPAGVKMCVSNPALWQAVADGGEG